MSCYNLCIRLSAVTSTSPVTDISGAPVNPSQIANVSPSSLFSASLGHTVAEAPCLKMEPSDVCVVGSGKTNLEFGNDVNADNPFIDKEMYSTIPDRDTIIKNPDEDLIKSTDEISVNNDEKRKKLKKHTKKSKKINPKSYLGAAFKEAKEFKIQNHEGCKTHISWDSSSEDLDSESSDSSYSSESSDNLSMDPLSDSDTSISDSDSSDSNVESSLDFDMSIWFFAPKMRNYGLQPVKD
ncbi:uncharacterized protein LACBIDRAFT_325303 [Laccaria bicolor S238N-H82]|uniref:Predicted protein n=1 Tax=Laccaria bicolor (strain S238N-H82 / ATCC MYA-4686) TaxID=486041 RepID=B0D4H0_LACBS|nr:uncharacterized protein LACBIDRAFT_325303 [Laccaria bicolor S238N-H82]EDR10562.1 predicted protein [Laccaria bicolor S238N-H82]|eukprot:XP_001879012.1 predicted protein [Laccaria bicolor S238N-H82]